MKNRNSSHQIAEKSRPEVEKIAPAEYITKEFFLPSTPKMEVHGNFRVT